MEEQAIARLLELDGKAAEISMERERELVELEKSYKEKNQQLIKDYINKAENDSKQAAEKILQEGLKEIDAINLKTRAILEEMERKFESCQNEIADEVLKRIFDIKRENCG